MSHPATTYTINGTVSTADAAGNLTPLQAVNIVLSDTDGTTQNTVTAVNGTFAFTALPTGDYTLQANANGYAFSPPSHQYLPLRSNVTGMAFTGAKLTVSGRTLLTGSAPTPLGGCLVQLIDPSGGQQMTTSDPTTGRYVFATGLLSGQSYTVEAAKDGYTPAFGDTPLPAGPLSAPVERDLYFTQDPAESWVTTWLLPIVSIVSPAGIAALGWSIYTYLKPNLSPGAAASDVQAAAAQLSVNQIAESGVGNGILSPQGAAAAKAAGSGDATLANASTEATETLATQAQTQVADNVAQRVLNTLTDTSTTDQQVIRALGSIGGEEMPTVVETISQAQSNAEILARIRAVFDTAIDWPAAPPPAADAVAFGPSGWSGAVAEAANSGVGVSVDAGAMAELLPEVESLEVAAEAGEGVAVIADVVVGAIVCVG